MYDIQKNDYDLVKRKEELISRYIQYLDVAEKTQNTYQNGLKMFFEYLYTRNIKNPAREDILGFKDLLKETRTLNTTNTYMIAIRNFFKWLSYEKIYDNITENIKGVNTGNNHKRLPLSNEQFLMVLNGCKNNREKMILCLTTSLGLRANEIVNIRLSDFKEIDGVVCLYLLGKGRDGKVDYVPINDDLYKMIQDYIQEYRITDYLFTSLRSDVGGKVTTKTIRYIVKEMFKRVGICSDEYSLHSLRHTFATTSIKNGADVREVSKALRHKSIHTTEIYLHDIEMQNNKCFGITNELFIKGGTNNA